PAAWAVRMGFKVDDLDATVADIERLGGTVTERGDTWVMADDDQGVPLVLWTPGRDHPHAPPTKAATGELSWFEILVPSAERGVAFYSELLGWQVMQFEPGPYWHVVDANGGSNGGITEAPDDLRVIPCATVPDIEAKRARIVE